MELQERLKKFPFVYKREGYSDFTVYEDDYSGVNIRPGRNIRVVPEEVGIPNKGIVKGCVVIMSDDGVVVGQTLVDNIFYDRYSKSRIYEFYLKSGFPWFGFRRLL